MSFSYFSTLAGFHLLKSSIQHVLWFNGIKPILYVSCIKPLRPPLIWKTSPFPPPNPYWQAPNISMSYWWNKRLMSMSTYLQKWQEENNPLLQWFFKA